MVETKGVQDALFSFFLHVVFFTRESVSSSVSLDLVARVTIEGFWLRWRCSKLGGFLALMGLVDPTICGMFIVSAWYLTFSTNSLKEGKASFPFSLWSFITLSDHLILNHTGIFSTNDWIWDGKSNTFKLLMCSVAISTCWRKPLNSSKAVASLGGIFGQAFSLYSKSAQTIALWPKRYFRMSRARCMSSLGLELYTAVVLQSSWLYRLNTGT